MAGGAPASRGLRTKTGCLTCRRRRKKCDEQTPVCSLCHSSSRQCEWPTAQDLVDRRHASHSQSRHSVVAASATAARRPSTDASEPPDAICFRSESAAHQQLAMGMEGVLSRYFEDRYYNLLLLPACHPEFYHGWINEIKATMVKEKSLHYSVLANAASHVHFTDSSSQMQELALVYYSNALRSLSELLAQGCAFEEHDGLLMSVILLYLHGCIGRGTSPDVPRHVNATTRILSIRLFENPAPKVRPFTRLAIESAMYQIFLLSTGLWSQTGTVDFSFNAHFWLQAERLLGNLIPFPGMSNSKNSPVLGLPVALYRLAMSLKQFYQSPVRPTQAVLDRLTVEVQKWEAFVIDGRDVDPLSVNESPGRIHEYYRDTAYLFIVIISLLLQQVLQNMPSGNFPHQAPSDCWQIQTAVQILRQYQYDEQWFKCYIGNWLVYTLGFFMRTPEHVQLVRGDLERRWRLTRFGQVKWYRNDLEAYWGSLGVVSNTLQS